MGMDRTCSLSCKIKKKEFCSLNISLWVQSLIGEKHVVLSRCEDEVELRYQIGGKLVSFLFCFYGVAFCCVTYVAW